MPIENITANRDYPLPHPDNDLDVDVLRVITALQGIDTDVAALFASLSGKSNTNHGHVIGDITGLQAALNAKSAVGHGHSMSEVDGLTTALNSKAPLNSPSLTGTPTATTAETGENSTRIATTAWVKMLGFITGIADGGITTAKLADGGTTTAKLADGAVTFIKLAGAALASAGELLAGAANKLLTAAGIWAAQVPVARSVAQMANLDFNAFVNLKCDLDANLVLNQPSNVKPGQCGVWELTHVSAARTATIDGAYYLTEAGFQLEGTAGQVEKLWYYGTAGGKVELTRISVH